MKMGAETDEEMHTDDPLGFLSMTSEGSSEGPASTATVKEDNSGDASRDSSSFLASSMNVFNPVGRSFVGDIAGWVPLSVPSWTRSNSELGDSRFAWESSSRSEINDNGKNRTPTLLDVARQKSITSAEFLAAAANAPYELDLIDLVGVPFVEDEEGEVGDENDEGEGSQPPRAPAVSDADAASVGGCSSVGADNPTPPVVKGESEFSLSDSHEGRESHSQSNHNHHNNQSAHHRHRRREKRGNHFRHAFEGGLTPVHYFMRNCTDIDGSTVLRQLVF
jgi:hypothetical protein